jgi:hypothetical protein
MKQKQHWYLGFFSLFAFSALPGLLAGDWGQAVWLVWLVWALFFFLETDDEDEQSTNTSKETESADDK